MRDEKSSEGTPASTNGKVLSANKAASIKKNGNIVSECFYVNHNRSEYADHSLRWGLSGLSASKVF
jgi:hypothetical protein